jgi:hypothetical protein
MSLRVQWIEQATFGGVGQSARLSLPGARQTGGNAASMERAGNLMSARAIKSAASLAQHLFVDWQAGGKTLPDNLIIATNNAGAINRMANFGPHPTQAISISFQNIADQLLRLFPRLKTTVCWVPAKCDPGLPTRPQHRQATRRNATASQLRRCNIHRCGSLHSPKGCH